MSTCRPFLLVEPFDDQRFAELQAQQNAPHQVNASGLGWTDVFVGELLLTVQVQTPRTALFETRRQDDTYCSCSYCVQFVGRHSQASQASQASQDGRRTCVLLFYKRVFSTKLQTMLMYGLRVCDAFALQHNWNRESYREYYEDNSVRARLLHDLDDAYQHNTQLHVHLVDAKPELCAQLRKLSFREIASAVVLFEQCPVNLKKRLVAPTNAVILKQITIASNNDCDIQNTSALQEILVDFQIGCGAYNYICVGDLCRQLAQHNLKDLVPATLRGRPVTNIQKLLEQARCKQVSECWGWESASYVNSLSEIGFSMDLRLVCRIRVRTFDVAQDVVVLHKLLDNLLSWKTDKRYRFKSRKYEKQTDKPTGKTLLVKTGLQKGWLDHSNPAKKAGQQAMQARQNPTDQAVLATLPS